MQFLVSNLQCITVWLLLEKVTSFVKEVISLLCVNKHEAFKRLHSAPVENNNLRAMSPCFSPFIRLGKEVTILFPKSRGSLEII